MCQRWARAPTVPWVSFKGIPKFTGKHKSLQFFQFSEHAQRGRCRTCGFPIAVLEDRYAGQIGIVLLSLQPASLAKINVPDEWHNAQSKLPT